MLTQTPHGAVLARVRSAAEDEARTAAEVRNALQARPLPWLPSKFFYDDRGSALFDRITRLPEYYLTRTEEAMLPAVAREVVGRVRPRHLVELGSGLGAKVRTLLDAIAEAGALETCTLLDVSEPALAASLAGLAAERPGLRAHGIVGDFLTDLDALGAGGVGPRLMAFLGSTIGNIHPRDVPGFFHAAASVLAPGAGFLVGLDLVKDRARLEAAYNDAEGVTAEFNRNILRVIDARLGADFDPEAFEHVAFYNVEAAWIEMRLRAPRGCHARVPGAGVEVVLPPGGEIRTEISCKYTRPALESMLAGTGLRLEEWWTDGEAAFALALLRPAGDRP